MAVDSVAFVRAHNQAVLVTHRKDGGLQASPVRVLVDDEDRIVAVTKATTAKVRDLARDNRFALCILSDGWLGDWLTIEGSVEMRSLPGALAELRAFYLARDGQVDSPENIASLMETEQRLILQFNVARAAGTAAVQ